MTPRWLLFILFIVVVAVLAGTRKNQLSVDAGWKAVNAVPKYTRITRDHVQLQKGSTPLQRLVPWEAIAGKYALRDFNKGDIIHLAELSEAPKITHDNGHRI